MNRRYGALAVLFAAVAALLTTLPAGTAQDAAWKGNWRLVLLNQDRPGDRVVLGELKFEGEVKDKKVAAQLVSTEALFLRGADVQDKSAAVSAADKSVSFVLAKPGARHHVALYEKDGKLLGSIDYGTRRFPIRAEKASSLPPEEMGITRQFNAALEKKGAAREERLTELLAQFPKDDAVRFGVSAQLFLAALEPEKPDAEKAAKSATAYLEAHAPYGREVELATNLWVAGEYAKKKLDGPAEKHARAARTHLRDDAPPEVAVAALRVLLPLLEKYAATDPQKAELAADKKRLETLTGDAEKAVDEALKEGLKAAGFESKPLARPEGAKDRAVLVELFTGAEAPSTAATELAVQQLLSESKGTELVLVTYHLDLPDAPDPLSSKAAVARAAARDVGGLPKVFVDGVAQKSVLGTFPRTPKGFEVVKDVHAALRKAVEAQLAEKPGAKIDLTAEGKADAVKVTVALSDLPADAAALRVRAVLVEDAYTRAGRNGVRVHQRFARALIGKDEGFEVKKGADGKPEKIEAEVKLADVKKAIGDHFKDAEGRPRLPAGVEPPLDLQKLRVVVFVEETKTQGEKKTTAVLQSAEKEIKKVD